MKSFILSASILAIFVGLSSCEKHDWDKTKKLYESHDAHGHDDHAGHGHGEHSEDSHGAHADEEHDEHAAETPSDKGHDHSGHAAH